LKKSSGSITELLAPQQKVLVQVMKEPTGTKGPRLTGNITLPGRYLVLMPYGRGVNLSRRIRSETERNRLKALAILIKPSGMGLLVRTEAEGMAEDAILEDLESLQKQWENVQQEGSSTRPPALLNRDNDFIQRVLRDMYSGDVNRIVVDSHSGIKRVKQHLMNWSAGKAPQGVLIDHHRERIPILEYFRVNAAIREALRPRVDLPSGGYVVIEPTEALTVIDVNSGSFTRSATSRETVLWTNCEAATEIARQLRLRNIAGVIIVDFIDMDSRRDQLQVLEHFNKVLKADKARPQIAQLSELGLVELTRKRQGQNIYELFGRPCQTCNGLGHLVHLPGESEVEPTESMTTGERVVLTPRSGLSVSSLPEITERLLPEKTIVLDAPQPREEPETVELDSSSNLQDLELINHPSYQDISTAGNARRRRRRRIGELDSLVRDSEPSRNHLRLAPTSGYNENRPELQLSEGLPTRSTLAERSRTVKSETLKPPTEQPEVISVEMTSDEQQMYAMMGISPLLLSHQTLKNTRNVIVTVRLPGEEPPSPKDLLEESEEEPIEVPSPEPFFESTVSMDSYSIEPPEETAVEEFSPSPSLAVAEDLEDSLDLEDDSDSSSRRRRRRRSSAVPD
jgi:ribonuclease E